MSFHQAENAFPTLDTIIIDHIKMAIAKANGKIAWA